MEMRVTLRPSTPHEGVYVGYYRRLALQGAVVHVVAVACSLECQPTVATSDGLPAVESTWAGAAVRVAEGRQLQLGGMIYL